MQSISYVDSHILAVVVAVWILLLAAFVMVNIADGVGYYATYYYPRVEDYAVDSAVVAGAIHDSDSCLEIRTGADLVVAETELVAVVVVVALLEE